MRKKNPIYSEIVLNNVRRERGTLSKHACANIKGVRKYPLREKVHDRENIRPIFFHDTDKIIHSLAYARYIDKTQVFSLFENDHITHRVLHVQFVSKIGRVIGRALKLNEDLIEAISAGHDLGHVPYGHDGENFLNEICKKYNIGFFTHGAQSVRFLEELEGRGKGLNLSLQVLDGILSHNGEMLYAKYEPERSKNWEKFDEEYRRCFTDENYYKKIFPMTLEGCVVRISDVIAYIGRDIEDAIELKIIKRKDIPKKIIRILGSHNSEMIDNLVMDLIEKSYDKPYLMFSKSIYNALKDLKNFNYERIYFDPRIKTQIYKIENMFQLLYKKYYDDVVNENRESTIYKNFLKYMNNRYLTNTSIERKVIDFIAGMTDGYFNKQFKKYLVPQSYGSNIKSSNLHR